MERLDEQILQLKYKIKGRERLQNLVEKLVDLQRELEIKKNSLHEQLKKEELDVEKLESLSIHGFLHMLKGDKDEMLEKEKSEVLAAKLKYDGVSTELQGISDKIRSLSIRISEYDSIDVEYAKLIEEKEGLIRSGKIKPSQEINSIMEEQASLKSRDNEINEALGAGHELVNSLNQVLDSLQSAHNWGVWDMFGGGLISTMAKHSRIDEAKKQIDGAQALLRRFHKELEDVGGSVEINIEMGSFLTFADYFFDGIFVDWAVQSTINEAQDRVTDTIDKVNSILSKLDEELSYIHKKLNSLESKRRDIIENS